MRWMGGDFWHHMVILTMHGESHLACPSCQVVPATTQKSPHVAILTMCEKSHFAPTSHALMSNCPYHHTSHLMWPFSPCMRKGTLHPPCMPSCQVVPSTMQKSPRVTILTSRNNLILRPPCMLPSMQKIIPFTSHGKIPKKSHSNPHSINKVPLMSHQ